MLTAPYKAYREEVRVRVGVEHEKEEIQEAKEKVQKELNDMRVPELRLALDHGGFGAGYIHDDDGAARFSFFFVLTLSSHRAESIADNWRAFVRVPGSDAGLPMAIEYHPATTVKRAFPNMPDLGLTDADSICERALAAPIQKGNRIKGYMMCVPPEEVPESLYRDPETTVTIEFEDNEGRAYSYSSGRGSDAVPPKLHPGLRRK